MNPTPPTSPAVLPAARIPMRSPLLERLTFLNLLIGLVAAASYALGTATALRVFKPATGAWIEAHQFYLMEGSATALGLVIGIRSGRRLAVESMGERNGANFVIILAALGGRRWFTFVPRRRASVGAGVAEVWRVGLSIAKDMKPPEGFSGSPLRRSISARPQASPRWPGLR